jgi:hypothetical protein
MSLPMRSAWIEIGVGIGGGVSVESLLVPGMWIRTNCQSSINRDMISHIEA